MNSIRFTSTLVQPINAAAKLIFALVILTIIVISAPAHAVIGSCADRFNDGLQTNTNNGEIIFNFDSILRNNPDNQLESVSITQSNFDVNSCDSQGECGASGTPAILIDLAAFPANSATIDVTVPTNQTATLGNSGNNQYDNVQVNNRGTLEFSSSFTEYHINSLTLQGHPNFNGGQLNLTAGDYYISQLFVNSSNVKINVVGAGTARLFIENTLTINTDSLINAPAFGSSGDPTKLFIYGYSDINFNNQTTGSAIIYAVGNVNLNSQSFVYGAINAENITLGSTSEVSFDQNAVDNADYGDICGPAAGIIGLIGEWRFDELFWNGSNNEVVDSSGNALHLTAFSAITDNSSPAISGDPGTCAYGVFNGSISFIQLDDDTSTNDSLLDIPDNLTVTTWINTNVIPTSGLKSILSKDENYEFHINTNGQIYWWWRWATLTTTGPPLTIGQWHHIAITWRSGEQVIYIDGIERARSARTGSLDINNDPLQVGQDLNIASRFFDGEIDEVRIYENFLTVDEVNQVMNETHPCDNSTVCTLTFEDNFNTLSYSNSTGSQPWSGDWIESSDDNAPSSGNVQITGGQLRMDDRPNSGGRPSLQRDLNLNGFISAFISVDLRTSGRLENSDRFDLAVSADGGNSFTILAAFRNDFSGNFSYDLTPYMATNTQIRFRIENNYGGFNEYIDINNVVITGFKNCGPDHFTILHDGAGINCLREAITIQAKNLDGSVMTDYTGNINISTLTNNGNWFVTDNNGNSSDPALGNLNDTANDNNGNASYQFVANDLGSIVLYLENTVAETTNINVVENGIFDDNLEGDITFRPFGFVFSPSPISTQIAGRPFSINLTAAGQTPSQLECGVIEEYDGSKSINFWSDYTSPITSPTNITVNTLAIATDETSSSTQNVVFTNGIATVEIEYQDVGQIALHAKDDLDIGDPPSDNLDEIIGGISPFIVRPFAYDLIIASDPYAIDGSSSVYTSAGATFDLTIRSVQWQAADDVNNDGIPDPFVDTNSDGIPDSGGDLSNNNVTANIYQINENINLSPTAVVVTNSNGNLSVANVTLSSFSPAGSVGEGRLTISQSWNEVGILNLNASSVNFMNSNQNVTGERINIGRFIPDHLTVSAPLILEQCGSFSYAGYFDGINAGLNKNGQPFAVSGTITAQDPVNRTTQNYAGEFSKLTRNDILTQAYNFDLSQVASGSINFLSDNLNFISGVSNYSDPDSDFQYNAFLAPFNLQVNLSVTDADGVSSSIASSNAVEVRLGRLRLTDSYGPELSDLEMPIYADYFNGTRWQLNSNDNCTNYIDTLQDFNVTTYTDALSDGETSILSPASLTSLNAGTSELGNGFLFSAPGENNFGSVQVSFDLQTQPWLRFDWDENLILDNASALLSFGYYRGSDRIIYWREIKK